MLQRDDRDGHRSNPARGGGGRAARCGAAGKDLDDDHAAAAARAWRTMIGRGVQIGGVVRRRQINRHRGGDQLPGACNVGLTTGARQQPVVADAVKPLWQNVEQKAPDELVGGKGHCAVPRLAVAAVILVAKGHAALVERNELFAMATRWV